MEKRRGPEVTSTGEEPGTRAEGPETGSKTPGPVKNPPRMQFQGGHNAKRRQHGRHSE